MKSLFLRVTLSGIIFFLVPSLSLAQWVHTAGPYVGRIYAIAASPNGTGGSELFAGTDGGVFLTTDNGTQWTAKTSDLSYTSIRALALSPNGEKIFAGTWGGGVLLSTDNGMNWQTVNTGLTSTYITALLVYADRSGDTDVFAGTNGGGMFRSTDNGASWGAVNVNPPAVGSPSVFNAFAVSDTNIFAGTDDGVFLSTDGGATWNPKDANLGYVPEVDVYSLAASPNGAGGTDIFAGTATGVFISANNGSDWNQAGSNPQLQLDTICVLSASSNGSGGTNLFAGAHDGGVFISTDNGSSWSTVTALKNSDVLSIAGIPSGAGDTDVVAGTYRDGAFLSSDNGASWETINTGLETADQALDIVPNSSGSTNIVVGTQSGIYLSTDNCASWREVGPANTSISSFVSSPNGAAGTNLFAGTGAGVFLSTDFGATWTAVNAGLGNTNVVSLAVTANPAGGANIFAGTYGSGIYLSTNNGQSWKAVNSGFPGFIIVRSLAVFPNGTGVPEVFAGTTSGLYVSTDNGTSWKSASTALANHQVFSVCVSPEGAKGTNIVAGADTGVFVSTNGGASWRSTGLTEWASSFTAFKNGTNSTNLFAGSGAGLYLSSDNGVTWGAGMAVAGNGASSLAIYPNDTSGNEILAGTTFNGVYQTPLSEMVTAVASRFSTTSVDFGNVRKDEARDTTIVISNNSFQTLQISNITSSNASFSATPTVKSVAPGQAFTDSLRFVPTAVGNSSGRLFVSSNAISSPDTIRVSGYGTGTPVLKLNTRVISFGDVKVGEYEDTTITITNNGDDTLRISSIASRKSDFLSRSNVADVAPSKSLNDTLLFAPIAKGPVSSFVLISSNAATSPDTLFVSGNGTVTSVQLPTGIPNVYSLSQNYPDPFNPSTVIRFGLASRSMVKLAVYNTLGQKVKELVDSELEAGYHEVVWRADVPSGVYFYRLEAISTGNSGRKFVETRKMALIR